MRKAKSSRDRFENLKSGISLTVITTLAFIFLGNKNIPPTTTLTETPVSLETPLQKLKKNPRITDTPNIIFPKEEFIDYRDNQKYPMLKINNRWWMGKNLNFKTSNSSCYNNQSECLEFGMLYTWDDATTACPKNWRLPSEEEWSSMLRSAYGKNQECPNCYASLIENGISGFEGKLGGFKSSNGSSYFTENNYGYYWTGTASDALNAEYFVFSQPKKYLNKSSGLKSSGYSCRCILEEGKEPSDTSSTSIASSPQSTELEITPPSSQPTKPGITTPSSQPTKPETTTPSSQPTKPEITTPSSQPTKPENSTTSSQSTEPEITTPSSQPTKPLFKTGSFVDRRNNQTYPTVRINGKWWMAENLNYPTKGSFYYDDEIEKYGLLYTWKSAQKACPKGWHLPSDDEWLEMTRYIGTGLNDQGVEVYDYLIVGGASQFNAVFGGVREKGRKGKYLSLDEIGYYWSSTKKDKKEAWFYGFSNLLEENKLIRSDENKDWGLSCRCVRN